MPRDPWVEKWKCGSHKYHKRETFCFYNLCKMKNWEMTNLIRQKYVFLYHGTQFECFDLTLEDYLLFSIDPDAWYKKVLLECNDELPKLNARQSKEFVRILFGGPEEKKEIIENLTETQKKINDFKKKNWKIEDVKKEVENMLQDFHIIEGQMMHFLKQPLSEMRKWPYKYFMQVYKDLAYCTGAKEYEKNRNSKAPDKKAFKKEFWSLYK